MFKRRKERFEVKASSINYWYDGKNFRFETLFPGDIVEVI